MFIHDNIYEIVVHRSLENYTLTCNTNKFLYHMSYRLWISLYVENRLFVVHSKFNIFCDKIFSKKS